MEKLVKHPDFRNPKYTKVVQSYQTAVSVAIQNLEQVVTAMDAEEDARKQALEQFAIALDVDENVRKQDLVEPVVTTLDEDEDLHKQDRENVELADLFDSEDEVRVNLAPLSLVEPAAPIPPIHNPIDLIRGYDISQLPDVSPTVDKRPDINICIPPPTLLAASSMASATLQPLAPLSQLPTGAIPSQITLANYRQQLPSVGGSIGPSTRTMPIPMAAGIPLPLSQPKVALPIPLSSSTTLQPQTPYDR